MYDSQISGHADSDKEMKQFSSLRYDGTLHGPYLRASSVSRRIEVPSKFYSYMLVSFSYYKHAVYAAR